MEIPRTGKKSRGNLEFRNLHSENFTIEEEMIDRARKSIVKPKTKIFRGKLEEIDLTELIGNMEIF